ncbi:hypothetical protein CcaCcLH18_14376 [Colletotrichum camelliae]|nr:hypothetical protein CcaCcLH18_14376 [Colletotrichum camelliae]
MYNDELHNLMENWRQRSEARDENEITLTETAVQGPFATEQREQEENVMVVCKDDEEPNYERTENLSLVQAAAKNDGAQGFSPCAKSSRKRAASESMMQQAERRVRRKNDIEPKDIFGHPLKREGPPKDAETLRGKEDRRACVLESGLHTSDGDTMQEGTQDDFGGCVDKGRSAGELTEEVIIRKEFAKIDSKYTRHFDDGAYFFQQRALLRNKLTFRREERNKFLVCKLQMNIAFQVNLYLTLL